MTKRTREDEIRADRRNNRVRKAQKQFISEKGYVTPGPSTEQPTAQQKPTQAVEAPKASPTPRPVLNPRNITVSGGCTDITVKTATITDTHTLKSHSHIMPQNARGTSPGGRFNADNGETSMKFSGSVVIAVLIIFILSMEVTHSYNVTNLLEKQNSVERSNDIYLLSDFLSTNKFMNNYIQSITHYCIPKFVLTVNTDSAGASFDISPVSDFSGWINSIYFFMFLIVLWLVPMSTKDEFNAEVEDIPTNGKEINGLKIAKSFKSIAKLIPIVNLITNFQFMTTALFFLFQGKEFMTDEYGTDSSKAFLYITGTYVFVLFLYFFAIKNPKINARLYFYRWKCFVLYVVVFLTFYYVSYSCLAENLLSHQFLIKNQIASLIQSSYKNGTNGVTYEEHFNDTWGELKDNSEKQASAIFSHLSVLKSFFEIFLPCTVIFFCFTFLYTCLNDAVETELDYHLVTITSGLETVFRFCGPKVLIFANKKTRDVNFKGYDKCVTNAMLVNVIQMCLMHAVMNIQNSDLASLGCGQVHGFELLIWLSYMCCLMQYFNDNTEYHKFKKDPNQLLTCLKDKGCNTHKTFYARGAYTWTFSSQYACYIFVGFMVPTSHMIQTLYVSFFDFKKDDFDGMTLHSFIVHVTAIEHLDKHLIAILWGVLCCFTAASLFGDCLEEIIFTDKHWIRGVSRELTQELSEIEIYDG